MKGIGKTLPEMFHRSVERFPDTPALMGSVKGKYQSVTYRQMTEKVRSFGKGLIALGVGRYCPSVREPTGMGYR